MSAATMGLPAAFLESKERAKQGTRQRFDCYQDAIKGSDGRIHVLSDLDSWKRFLTREAIPEIVLPQRQEIKQMMLEVVLKTGEVR